MKLNKKLWRTLLTVALALLVGAVADGQALPGCKHTCGGAEIPYPFGMGTSGNEKCYLNRRFMLTCNLTDSKLYIGKGVQVIQIDIVQNQMDVLFDVSTFCSSDDNNGPSLDASWLSISSKANKFFTIGCDSYGFLKRFYNNDSYSTGCLTQCDNQRKMIDNGTCSGSGCCQVDIPPGMRNITIKASSFNDSMQTLGDCSYSFVVKKDNYTFSPTHLRGLPFKKSRMVLDWTVGDGNCSASESTTDYACNGNSECVDNDTDHDGYRCKCKDGFEGNPYHPEGCRDINECASNHTCISRDNCQNTFGSYYCFCPKGQSGNGTKEGGCHQRDVPTKVVIGAGIGVIVLLVGISLLYLMYQKWKLIKLKEKFFRQNGGLILLQQLSTRVFPSQTVQIFTEDQLKKATNNYAENKIIGRGGYGTVFLGILADKRIVAIKKSKIIDASCSEQFINEMVVLSQINHRNVVKLLGCCLETEVPLLVYEFASNGNLSDFIHREGSANNAPWKTRLKIATEVAEALSYLHSAVPMPVIHRDVKSSNILLDDNHTAKLHDFDASILVPLDQTVIDNEVKGTIGYLDPEYMQTSQLTAKSDVYSFGVVLVELLTGEKPFSFNRSEEIRSLGMHFLSCWKNDDVFEVFQDGILNEENKQEIKEVATLATKCLRLKGEERPSMMEVAVDLQGLRLMEKHTRIN